METAASMSTSAVQSPYGMSMAVRLLGDPLQQHEHRCGLHDELPTANLLERDDQPLRGAAANAARGRRRRVPWRSGGRLGMSKLTSLGDAEELVDVPGVGDEVGGEGGGKLKKYRFSVRCCCGCFEVDYDDDG